MSLLLALLIILLLAAATLAAVLWYAYAREDLERLRQQEHWYGRFVRSTNILMNDERVPKAFLQMLANLNNVILEKQGAHVLYQIYRNPGPAPDLVSVVEDGTSFYDKDPELSKVVKEVLNSGLMAMSYTNVVWGEKARNAMVRYRRGENILPELTATANQVTREDNNIPSGLLAA